MFRHRPAPRHRGDPRRHGGLGEQLVICVLAVQISVAWLPSPRADSSGPSRSADQPPALVGLPASPPTSAPEPPTEIEVRFPASVTRVERAHEVRKRVEAVKTVSTNGIPSATLAAYQRAEAVMNSADAGCNISWQLIAAIGRVESDHGRYGGNVVGPTGVSRPGIYGIALNGTRNTAEIRDTDAGEYDRDPLYDRAVGPMQFIPSTWSVVGVDADGDGKRNPQDIDDAALAAAVYLCSGDGDLSTDADRRQAVYRYNHSTEYVDLVLAIMNAYLDGDYSTVPNYTTSATTFIPDFDYTSPGLNNGGGKKNNNGGKDNDGNTDPDPVDPDPVDPDPVDPDPVDPGDDPVKVIEDTVKNVQDGVKDVVDTVNTVLSLAEAIIQCTVEGYNALLTPAAWNACIDGYTNP